MTPRVEGLAAMARTTGHDVRLLPDGLVVVAHDPRSGWSVTPGLDAVRSERLAVFCELLQTLRGPLRNDRWWALLTVADGWREDEPWVPEVRWRTAGTDPGTWPEPPSACASTVLCLGLQHGDETGTLVPDTHWVWSRWYARQRLAGRKAGPSYAERGARAVYAGNPHGNPLNVLGGDRTTTPRQLLQRVVERERLPVDLHIGHHVTEAAQRAHRSILDVDGHARTWDAWSWKTRSGSVVLSQESRWQSWFTRQFQPWAHYVPVANDFVDLGERLSWVDENPDECAGMAAAAARRAAEVYDPDVVRPQLRELLESVVVW